MPTPKKSSLLGALGAVAGLLLAFGAPSCDSPVVDSNPPVILGMNVESTNITAGVTIDVSVEAVATGPMTYGWLSEREDGTESGDFADPEDSATQWTAPFEEGVILLRISVRDARGAVASRAVPVLVGPATDDDDAADDDDTAPSDDDDDLAPPSGTGDDDDSTMDPPSFGCACQAVALSAGSMWVPPMLMLVGMLRQRRV